LLIDEGGKSLGVVSYDQAMWLAEERGYDLVELNPDSNPPICKLIDYGKYKYSQEKKARKQKAKSKSGELKEIRLGLKIGKHDLDIKAKRGEKFLEKGNKVRIFLILKGRERMFHDKAIELINTFKDKIGGKLEDKIERMGARFSATIIRK
jgi:translation initiation factor IF-3